MQAIIPLAGKGTRLRPLTHTRPKPLVRVADRPVLDHVLDMLEEAGVERLVGITGYMEDEIRAHLRKTRPDLEMRFVTQEEQLGTAHAIRLAEPHVDGPVLIVFVDTIFEADLGVIGERSDDDGIVWAKEVEDYQRFGVIVTDDEGYMERIVEKPDEPVSRLANIGVYYVRDHELMFEGIRRVLERDPHLGEYFLTDAFQHMIDHGARLYTAEVGGWWDCGKPGTLLETNRVLLERGGGRRPEGPDVSVEGPVHVAEGAAVAGSRLGPNVTVGTGCEIRGSRLRDCIVGEETVLERCDLRGSLVGDRVELRDVSGRVLAGDDTRIEEG